jgi:hypothetical protein
MPMRSHFAIANNVYRESESGNLFWRFLKEIAIEAKQISRS